MSVADHAFYSCHILPAYLVERARRGVRQPSLSLRRALCYLELTMIACMFRLIGEQLEILDAVIRDVAVLVMHYLFRIKITT